jgi:hypothetical protein
MAAGRRLTLAGQDRQGRYFRRAATIATCQLRLWSSTAAKLPYQLTLNSRRHFQQRYLPCTGTEMERWNMRQYESPILLTTWFHIVIGKSIGRFRSKQESDALNVYLQMPKYAGDMKEDHRVPRKPLALRSPTRIGQSDYGRE